MIFFKRVVINKTDKTAVILTYPGIGDIVWHLPFLHALAKVSNHKQIYLYTRSTTLAKDILKYMSACTVDLETLLGNLSRNINTAHFAQWYLSSY